MEAVPSPQRQTEGAFGDDRMNIALCYESVLPARGGCETYIGDLSRRLAQDGHEVHLYACRWDANALPASIQYHRLQVPNGPRFLRPWRFGHAVEAALAGANHDVTVGFDKTWGQDVLYPQGGLHVASAAHNRRKHRNRLLRTVASLAKWFDPAAWSFAKLERKQYLGTTHSTVVVNSEMVQSHFSKYYCIGSEQLRVVHSAIDPTRFESADRDSIRQHQRATWLVKPDDPVGLFIGTNYRLKGLAPLIRALAELPKELPLKIAVVGHNKVVAYELLARSLGVRDRLIFLGFRASPKDLYFAADFLVHPTFYDPCSLVVLEALACGLPIITTQYNGASELLVPLANSLIIDDPHNAKELAAALAKMARPSYRVTRTEYAIAGARDWTFEHHYAALVAIFEEVRTRKQQLR